MPNGKGNANVEPDIKNNKLIKMILELQDDKKLLKLEVHKLQVLK